MLEAMSRASFARVMLGLNGGTADRLVVMTGCELARAYKAELVAVHVLEVDWRHDLSEVVPGSTERASAILDLAEAAAERSRISLQTELLQARDVGAALVDEATALGADVIILGLPFRKKFGGDFAVGHTVPYVLQNAPMTVFVVREPIPSPTAAGAPGPTRGRTLATPAASGVG